MRRLIRLALLAVALWSGAAAAARAADSAVVLVYQRFGETERHPYDSVSLAQFEAHLDALAAGGYAVLPLAEILRRIGAGEALPERTVAITIDNAFRSALREAWPRLRARGLPVTLFVASDAVDAGDPAVMGWDDLRALAAEGVAIESRGASNRILWRLDEAARRADIVRGRARIEAEIGRAPRLFAYPSGEQDAGLRAELAALGFTAAFGLRSGPVYAGAPAFDLPRFELNLPYGDARRLETIAKVAPLPVSEIEPAEPVLAAPLPAISFRVAQAVGALDRLACYASGQGRVAHAVDAGRRVRVTLNAPLRPGHNNRVNCTLPMEDGRYRWLGLQYVVP